MSKTIQILAVLLAVAALSVAGPAESVAPNTLALGLGGYSPVSYFEADGPQFGSPRFLASHAGVTYLLRSKADVAKFNADPEKYTPLYGGWCAYGMAVKGKFPADPTNFKIVGGRLHVFLRNEKVDTLGLWNKGKEPELRRKADAYWTEINSKS